MQLWHCGYAESASVTSSWVFEDWAEVCWRETVEANVDVKAQGFDHIHMRVFPYCWHR